MDDKQKAASSEQTYVDPVCGMTVTAEDSAGSYEYKGTTYYFCGPGCKRSFEKDPEKFLSPDYKPSM
ncbi:MAG: YHS domain-containing protein [Chloroflexi bacterium]|nr:YHS domain-containing protein [Chloroflexota bacterium]